MYALCDCMERDSFSTDLLAPAVRVVYEYLDDVKKEIKRQMDEIKTDIRA